MALSLPESMIFFFLKLAHLCYDELDTATAALLGSSWMPSQDPFPNLHWMIFRCLIHPVPGALHLLLSLALGNVAACATG